MTATDTAPAAIRRGSTVWVLDPATLTPSHKYPGPWQVDRVNDKSYSLSQGRAKLRAGKTVVTTADPATQPAAQVIDWREPWVRGTLVRWAGAPANALTTLFVVITDSGLPTVGLVPLGNKCGRRWPKVPVAALTVVDPADVLLPGAAAA